MWYRGILCAAVLLISTAVSAATDVVSASRLQPLPRPPSFAGSPGLVADYRLFREGYRFWQEGSPAKAYAVLDSIHQALPPIDDLRLYATAATALASGRTHQATTLFNQLIAEYSASPWSRAAAEKLAKTQVPPVPVVEPSLKESDAETLELYATTLFRLREYKKVTPVLEELLRRKGEDDLKLMTTLASAYARSNRFDEAIALQKKIATQFPNEARRATYKIVFLQADRGRDKDAILVARDFLDRYPNSSENDDVMWILAWSHYRLKEWTPAIALFAGYRDVVGSRAKKTRADYWSARCLEQMGNKAGASAAYGAVASQDVGGYYGHLASARLRHKPIAWQLPLPRKFSPVKLNTTSAATLLAGLDLYELIPVVGWSGSYKELIDTVAPVWGLNSGLVNAIIQVESHFNPNATSPAGAIGLMQLIPPTAQQMADEMHLDVFTQKDLRNPIWNVTLGMVYLRKLSAMYSRNMVALIASYNAGEKAVSRWMEFRPLVDPEMFIEEIPYDETNAYVKKVLSLIW